MRYMLTLLVGAAVLFGSWFSTGDVKGGAVTIEAFTSFEKIRVHVQIPGFETKDVETRAGTFIDLHAPGAGRNSDIGSPKLPVIRRMIEIPENADVTVDAVVIRKGQTVLSHPVLPVQPPVPKIKNPRVEFAYNRNIYEKDEFLPGINAKVVDIVRIRGHRIAVVEIYPFQYNPAKNLLEYASEIEVTLHLKDSDPAKTTATLERYYSPLFEKLLSKQILNYGYFESGIKPPDLPIGYLIIVADDYYNNILPFAEWKERKGYYTTVTKTSQIPGGPTAENIRAYIQDAYSNWEVPPTFVLLVGDVNTIPAFTGDESNSPTDLYYGAVDGTDYFPDIWVGRFSAENADHVDVMVEKVIDYEKTDWINGVVWIKKAVFMASSDNHEISEGTHRYVIQNFLGPRGYYCDSLWYYHGATTSDITNAINNGRSLAVYSGHGSETGWEDGPPYYQSDIRYDQTNLDMYPLVCSHACLTGNYGYSSECFGETWVRVEDKGAVAFWGASTYSYWEEDDTLERAMFRALFNEDLTWLAGMMDRAKYAVYQAGLSAKYYYEEYNLLGDPSMNLWTDYPHDLVVNYPSTIPIGPNDIEVTVYADGSPVEDALVALRTQDTLVAGYTNPSGSVTLHIETEEAETVWVTVTGYNLRPHLGFAVAQAAGPSVGFLKQYIDDSGGDGVVNPGETVDLTIWLKNFGSSAAHGVYAKLSESDPFVTILNDSVYYGYLAAGDSSAGTRTYSFSVNSSAPDQHYVEFELKIISSDGDTWIDNPGITVRKPVLEHVSDLIVDEDGNHVPSPGEDIDLYARVANTGSVDADNVTAVLSMDSDPYVTMTSSTSHYGTIASGDTVTPYQPFEISIAEDCPDPYAVTLFMSMTTGSFTYVDTFVLTIRGKGFFDDIESGEGEWIHGGTNDLWHITTHRSNSPTHSWYSGVEGSWEYVNNMNAFLETPDIALFQESRLVFWTYYDLESNYDYGYVEISQDGGNTWHRIGETFSGSSEGWERVEIDLRDYSGTVRIRFRQTSDYSITYEGWYIDDVSVEEWPGPDIFVSPLSFDITLEPDTVDTFWLTITNIGELPLSFTISDTEWAEEVVSIAAITGKATLSIKDRESVNSTVRLEYTEPPKGEPDLWKGKPQLKNSGGPDGFGYTWVDSDELGGPTFQWIEINGVGTPLNLGDDDYETVSLPFTFSFYGEPRTEIKISSNGYLTFGTDGADYSNDPVPTVDDPNDFIAPFWDDLNPSVDGQVYYYYDNDNQRFIVEWYQVPHYYDEGSYTFETILYPDGSILFQYKAMDGVLDEATIGIENGDGTDGLQVVCNASYVHNVLAIWISKNEGWLTETPRCGLLDGGESMNIALIVNTQELDTGSYAAQLGISSNDPDQPLVNVDVNLSVEYQYLFGDVNDDGTVNQADLIYLANYLYGAGSPPQPVMESGDMNHDGAVTVSDLIVLADALYKEKPLSKLRGKISTKEVK